MRGRRARAHANPFDVLVWQLRQEPGRNSHSLLSEKPSDGSKAQDQPLFGAREGDIGESPLLLELFRILPRVDALERKHLLLEPGDHDHGKLEALRRVDGHQGDTIALCPFVGRGLKGHVLEEVGQRGFGVLALELVHRRDELLYVLKARIGLG